MTENKDKSEKGERIAKRLARAGICSRREAERLIAAGRVKVDGVKLTSPAFNVTEKNRITVDGEANRCAGTCRASGAITKPQARSRPRAIPKAAPPYSKNCRPICRASSASAGLISIPKDFCCSPMMASSPGISNLPQNAWLRHYRVRVHGHVDRKKLAALAKGITISGIHYEPIKVTLETEKTEGSNSGSRSHCAKARTAKSAR